MWVLGPLRKPPWRRTPLASHSCFLAGVKGSQLHHVASNKAITSGFTKAYEAIFKKGGLTLEAAANKILLPGHSGPHSIAYKQYVLDKLQAAIKGLNGREEIKKAIQTALGEIKKELKKNPDLIRMK
jgi:hypothetical protein